MRIQPSVRAAAIGWVILAAISCGLSTATPGICQAETLASTQMGLVRRPIANHRIRAAGALAEEATRESFEEPLPFETDVPACIKFSLSDISHVFRPGHRLMVQIESSWFPLFDRNPQKFVDIYSAGREDFQTARQRVNHSPDRAMRLRLPVLPM